MSDKDTSADKSRRKFLISIGGLSLIWVGGAAYPIARYLGPQTAPDPFGEDGRAVVEGIVPTEVAKPGMGKNGGYGGKGLIVFRHPDGKLRAFDSKCTHAGCNVAFEGERIYCHCHGGTYNLEGKNIAGPPPRPLTELGVEEEEDIIYVYRLPRGEAEEA